MAFIQKNLSALVYANGFTLWHYTTPDTPATIDTSGYFNTATDMLRVGDVILANHTTGGTAGVQLFPVRSNTGGVVDVGDGLAVPTTNTD